MQEMRIEAPSDGAQEAAAFFAKDINAQDEYREPRVPFSGHRATPNCCFLIYQDRNTGFSRR